MSIELNNIDPDLRGLDTAARNAGNSSDATNSTSQTLILANGQTAIVEDKKILNRRFHINNAMGVNPSSRAEVQERRNEVAKYLELNYEIRLDRVYADWSDAEWRRMLTAAHTEFGMKYGWSKYTCELVLKLICSDTARNLRSKRRNQLKRQQAAACSTQPTATVVANAGLQVNNSPKIKVYLRQPNRARQTPCERTPPTHDPNPPATSSMDSDKSSSDPGHITARPAPPLLNDSNASAPGCLDPGQLDKVLFLESVGKLNVSPSISWAQFQTLMAPHLPINEDQCYLVKNNAKRDSHWTILAFPDELPKALSCGNHLLFRREQLSWINRKETEEDSNYEGFENLAVLSTETPQAELSAESSLPKRKRGRPAKDKTSVTKEGTVTVGANGALLVAEEVDQIEQGMTAAGRRTRSGRLVHMSVKTKKNITLQAEKVLTNNLEKARKKLKVQRDADHKEFEMRT
ncbi:hypothetical protein BZA77DRAFT_369177 [Pyronema omphalodes]|nr:hypothetical protein BZA77DRAFT_369177 [Pyronema omphalodes]